MSFNSPKKSRASIKKGLRKWRTVMMKGRHSLDSSNGGSSSFQSSDRTELPEDVEEPKGPFKRLIPFLRKQQKEIQETGAKLRQQYSAGRLWCLIATVTMPMIILQICLLVFYPPDLKLLLNEEESIGRCKCGCSDRILLLRMCCPHQQQTLTVKDECGGGSSQTFQLPSICIVFVTMVVDMFQVQG